MIIIKGQYNEAVVYAESLEEESEKQIRRLCDQSFVAGSRIRMMPDVHAGAGCTIGTTMTLCDKIVPNLVGVDIGCGMESVILREDHMEFGKLDKLIYERIPSGFSIRKTAHFLLDEIDLSQLRCAEEGKLNLQRASLSLGTLGGGNHFIEVARDSKGKLYIVVHSGSRHLGLEVAKFYQEEAKKQIKGKAVEIHALIESLKLEGREVEIEQRLKESGAMEKIPGDLAYISGQVFEDYLHDMKIIQKFALLNRKAIMDEIIRGMKVHVEDRFTTIHNYIDTESYILRKGAVSAKKGERLLIPINMRDGSLVCEGKGNVEWNYSAPHGAGRLMSRAEAKRSFSVSAFKKEMVNVFSSSINKDTLDECPMAYKPMADIVSSLGETAEILEVIKPLYNFKAGGD